MGFYVRQSVRAGPFRFTFSQSGISMSAGTRGLRVGTGPRGSYVRVGAGGLSYRMSLPAGSPRPVPARPPAEVPPGLPPGLTPISSGDVLQMADVSSAALLDEINARQRRMRIGPPAAIVSAVLAVLVLANGALIMALAVALVGTVLTIAAFQRDAAVRAVVLMYDLEPFAEAAYDRLHQAFAALSSSHAIWNIHAQGAVNDWKRNAGASTLVGRTPVRPWTGAPAIIKTNIAVPVIPAGSHTLYLFPDRVLVFGPGGVGAVPYERLGVGFAPTRFVEEGPVPRDARVVDRTWRYVNKGGGPDRRFRDNREIPVVLYDEVCLSSDTGLKVVLQLSRLGTGGPLRSAVATLAAIATQPPARAAAPAPFAGIAPAAPAHGAGPAFPAGSPPASPVPPPPAPLLRPTEPLRPAGPAPVAEFSSGPPPIAPDRRVPDAVNALDQRPMVRVNAPEPAPTRRQPAAALRGETRWVPPGEPVEVDGYVLAGGMIYVGTRMRAVSEWRGTEPALIVPGLPLSRAPHLIDAAEAGYWPSYSDVEPAFRARYLRWLAGGRCDPQASLGCVFLFFYGIERRVLHDAEKGSVPVAEIGTLAAEVERLLEIYGGSGSFRGYATRFLELVRLRHGGVDLDPAAPPAGHGHELPVSLRARLGRFALEKAPIPAEWALAWVRFSPQVSLRTAATRCPDEFEAAFRHAYRKRFGEGMMVKPNKTRISLTYQPASGSFAGNALRVEVADLPDVSVLTAPVDRLRQVAESATEAIDRYSRWIGRTGEGESLAALALLPPDVLRRRVRRAPPPLLAELADALGPDGRATVPLSMLLRHWPAAKAGKLSKKEAEGFTEFLEKLGIGLAPDVRHTGVNPSQAEHAAVFLLPGEAPPPGPEFGAATLLLTLGAAVAGADELSHAEEEQIERHLESAYALGEVDRARLRGHLAWLRACPPSTAGLKKQLEPLAPDHRARIARALIAIAGADGHVSPAEVKMLTRLYPLLGLDAARVYADVHALAAGPGPVTVVPADPAREYPIPRPADAPAPAQPASGFALDLSRIKAITDETHDVTRVLASVFADPDEAAAATVAAADVDQPEDEEEAAAADERLPGLDAAHSALVRALGGRGEIAAAEFATLASAHALMPGGAIETINEAAFQLCDEPLLEGADPIEINAYAREELFR